EAWVLLLDGLDEVAPPARGRAIRMLNELRERHPVPIVVGSREVEYAASDARIECRGAVRISPIDAERRLHILEALGPATESFARDLREHPERGRRLTTPLLLTLAALGESAPDLKGDEPQLRAHLYDNFLRRTFAASAAKDGEDVAQLEAGARWLARAMRSRGLSEFWVERLQADWFDTRRTRFAVKALGLLLMLIVGLCITGGAGALTDREP